jgi:hypothetical protein
MEEEKKAKGRVACLVNVVERQGVEGVGQGEGMGQGGQGEEGVAEGVGQSWQGTKEGKKEWEEKRTKVQANLCVAFKLGRHFARLSWGLMRKR